MDVKVSGYVEQPVILWWIFLVQILHTHFEIQIEKCQWRIIDAIYC
jgi:hypothetical protein